MKALFICITLSSQVLYGIEHQKVAGITTEACIREVPVFRHCREVWRKNRFPAVYKGRESFGERIPATEGFNS